MPEKVKMVCRSQHPNYRLVDKHPMTYHHLHDSSYKGIRKTQGVPGDNLLVWIMGQERLLWCAFNGFPYQRSATGEWHYRSGPSRRKVRGHPFQ